MCLPGPHPNAMDNRPIAELTVDELQELIRRTVKKSVAEVMMEFAIEADVEAQVVYEAELNDLLRGEIRSGSKALALELAAPTKADD